MKLPILMLLLIAVCAVVSSGQQVVPVEESNNPTSVQDDQVRETARKVGLNLLHLMDFRVYQVS